MSQPPKSGSRGIPRGVIIGTIVAALLLVGILVAISASGGDSDASTGAITPVDVDEVTAQFAGISQQGERLGAPNAPVEIVEYADLQCPFCAQAAATTVPSLVTEFVRPGTAKLTFRPLTFIGPDSERGALAAVAAGSQGKLWEFTELLYRKQGAENSGWLSEQLVDDAASGLALDMAKFDEGRDSDAARAQVAAATATAQAESINSTPTFVVIGPKGRVVINDSSSLAEFRAAITGLK